MIVDSFPKSFSVLPSVAYLRNLHARYGCSIRLCASIPEKFNVPVSQGRRQSRKPKEREFACGRRSGRGASQNNLSLIRYEQNARTTQRSELLRRDIHGSMKKVYGEYITLRNKTITYEKMKSESEFVRSLRDRVCWESAVRCAAVPGRSAVCEMAC